MHKTLIAASRSAGVPVTSRLARIISPLDRAEIAYRLPIPGEDGGILDGRGTLHVGIRDSQTYCHVIGEIYRPNPFEFAFHSFWLTRRGMILIIMNLIARPSETPFFIKLTSQPARELKSQAAGWLKRRAENRKQKPD